MISSLSKSVHHNLPLNVVQDSLVPSTKIHCIHYVYICLSISLNVVQDSLVPSTKIHCIHYVYEFKGDFHRFSEHHSLMTFHRLNMSWAVTGLTKGLHNSMVCATNESASARIKGTPGKTSKGSDLESLSARMFWVSPSIHVVFLSTITWYDSLSTTNSIATPLALCDLKLTISLASHVSPV